MFHFWRPYPLIKPKNEGIYLCTMDDGKVLELRYWFKPDHGGVWQDHRRQFALDSYKVYKHGHEPLEYYRTFTDSLCERADIVAWTKKPRGSRLWRKR